MNTQQEGILWIGIMVVMVYLFTDNKFRDLIFNRGSGAEKTTMPYTSADITTQLNLAESTALPQSSTSSGGSGATLV